MILKNPYHLLKMISQRIRVVLLFSTLLTACLPAAAQVPNLSNVRSSQLSDEQLSAYLQKAMQSGLSQAQIEAELKRRGLSDQELMSLQSRIAGLQKNKGSVPVKPGKQTPDTTQNSRTIAPLPVAEAPAAILKEGYPVFGSEMFSNGNIRFEPDTRMATPASYILGPEDVINVDLSGRNDKTQNVKVSPEGIIRLDYIGEIYVSGLTVADASSRIRAKMTKIYPNLANGGTRLSVSLNTIRSIRIMVMGAVSKPAVYTLSSLSTVFHALYSCGGPTAEGSLRKIELIRGNKVVSVIDIYRFLMKGDQSQNIRLHDNDVIRVPFADNQVLITGQVKRFGWFELMPGEHMSQLLEYAGGFREDAFKALVTAERYNSREKEVLDIPDSLFSNTTLLPGDKINVGSVLDRYRNEVKIKGSVFRPGRYQLEKGMTIKRLIEKADGLKEEAYRRSALLSRYLTDRRKEVLTVNLDSILNDLAPDVPLRNEDELLVNSVFELEVEADIRISGQVRNPGVFPWKAGITLASLLQLAGGLTEFAAYDNIEVSRRLPFVDPKDSSAILTEKLVLKLDSLTLLPSGSKFLLQPYDIVSVRTNPYKKPQDIVNIAGQVLYPGAYPLLNKRERLSSLFARSGGGLPNSNLAGATLTRKRNIENVQVDSLVRRLAMNQKDSSTETVEKVFTDSTLIAINLSEAIANPEGPSDIILLPGDELNIPTFDPTIQISGEVLKPLSTYFYSKRLSHYINTAGGFLRSADRSKTFVVYANGQAAKTKKRLIFLNDYPKIKPGTHIFVPKEYVKPQKSTVNSMASLGMLSSILAAITTIILSLR